MKKIKEVNNAKNAIQNKALEMFQNNDLLLSWATGCGKSLAAIKCIEDDIQKNNSYWYIACWETTHIDNWLAEFKKYKKEHLLTNIELFCYASFHKIKKKGNVILDEAHHITDLSSKYIKEINPERIIMLSATVPLDKKKLLYDLKPFKEYNIPLEEAIDKGIIPPPKIYIVDVFLDNSKQTEEFIITKGVKDKRMVMECVYKDRFTYLKNHTDLELHVKCTQTEKYTLLSEQIDYYKKQFFSTRAKWAEFKWLNTGADRKKFIAECKTKKAKEILKLINDKRFICFTGSTEQCKELGGKNVISSSTKKTNDLRIEKFNKGKLSSLYAIKMLREGVNLYNIEAGLIVQLDNQVKSLVQMLGRIFRSKYPVMFILILKNTQDETYLNTSLEGFNTEYLLSYKNQSIEEIFNN